MRIYHHLGIPTTRRRPGERYLEEFGMYVSGFEESPFGVEWMRFEDDSPLPSLVKTVPHVAFQVNNLELELEGQEVLISGLLPCGVPAQSGTESLRGSLIVSLRA